MTSRAKLILLIHYYNIIKLLQYYYFWFLIKIFEIITSLILLVLKRENVKPEHKNKIFEFSRKYLDLDIGIAFSGFYFWTIIIIIILFFQKINKKFRLKIFQIKFVTKYFIPVRNKIFKDNTSIALIVCEIPSTSHYWIANLSTPTSRTISENSRGKNEEK